MAGLGWLESGSYQIGPFWCLSQNTVQCGGDIPWLLKYRNLMEFSMIASLWFSWWCSRDTIQKILARGHSRVPVYDGNKRNLVGLLLVCIPTSSLSQMLNPGHYTQPFGMSSFRWRHWWQYEQRMKSPSSRSAYARFLGQYSNPLQYTRCEFLYSEM